MRADALFARGLVALAGAGLLLSASAPDARAFSVGLAGGTNGQVIRWMSSTVGYYLHPACSADLATATCSAALRDSFAEWMGPACTSANFVDQGTSNTTNLTPVGDTNGKNELAFIETSQWYFGSYTLGVTSPVFYNDGSIIEADIVFNGLHHTWSTTGQWGTTDVKNVAVHEIGHMFGLQHNLSGYDPNNPPTMAPTADPNLKSRTPEPDDLKGVCFLLPAGAYSCSGDSDCPLIVDDGPSGEYYAGQLGCQGGFCGGVSNEIPQGNGTLGDTCVADADCAEPYFCQAFGSGQQLCAQLCNPNAGNCPSGFLCYPYSNGSDGVCLPGEDTGTEPGGELLATGLPCNTSLECESGLCVGESGGGAFCRQQCGGDPDCPQGQECSPLTSVNYGACVPASGTDPGPLGAPGDPCQGPDDCQSGLCVQDEDGVACRSSCGTDGDCPAGQECFPLSGVNFGACFPGDGQTDPNPGGKPLGGPCASGDECASGMCASAGFEYVCSEACSGPSDCPLGYQCVALDGGSGCFKGDDKPTGDACEGNQECASDSCISFDGEVWFCTEPCAASSDCPCGMRCVATRTVGDLCAPGVPVGCVPDGGPCAAATECVSGLCDGGTCSSTCSIFDPTVTCSAGLGCARADLASPDGWCTTPGPNGLGKPCSSDTDCASLFCLQGICRLPCEYSLGACAGGLTCEPAVGPIGFCDGATDPGGNPGGSDATSSGSDGTGTSTGDAVGPTPGAEVTPGGGTSGSFGGASNSSGCTASRSTGPLPLAAPCALLLLVGWRRRRATNPSEGAS